MSVDERFRAALGGAKRFLELLDRVADYDPIEEQHRWIARLEKRIASLEAIVSPEEGRSPREANDT